MHCVVCKNRSAQVRRPGTTEPYCKSCFFDAVETEVHRTIVSQQLFEPNDRVAIAISGGKDSTVLAHLMTLLNARHNYGLDLFLLAVDEGITGYRDDSLETVKRNEQQFGIPLTIVSYEDLYGWRMDQVVGTVGKKNNCTFCGVFRRQALDKGALLMKATKICTGHNADDAAETALMNVLRGDIGRFGRCSEAITGRDEKSALPRCKPLMFLYEKDIVLYARFKNLDYFSTECIYSPNAYRGHAREFIKLLEASNSQSINALLYSVTELYYADAMKTQSKPGSHHTAFFIAYMKGTFECVVSGHCERCHSMSSNKICKACILLDALNTRNPSVALVNKSRRKKLLRPHKKKIPHIDVQITSEDSSSLAPPALDVCRCSGKACS